MHPDEAEGEPYIGLEHIEQGTLHLNGFGYASDVTSGKSLFKKGDILFGKLRPYFRKVVRAPFDGVCSTDIWVVRAMGGVEQGFLYYWMASHEFVNFSMQGSEGTKMPRAKWEHVSRHQIPFFSPPEQRAIAHILGSLDDKIELNRRVNETLEAMAQALFKSWFVDFDPVIDNAIVAGKFIPDCVRQKSEVRREKLEEKYGNLSPSTLQTSPFHSLFPDEFEHTEKLGWIPRGWETGSLQDIADNPRRGVQAKDILEGTPYIGLQDMPQKSISLSMWGELDGVASGKFHFQKGEILFGKLRPYFHKVGIAPVDGVCSTDILVIIPKSPEWFAMVLGHITSISFIELVTAASTGTKMPRTNWDVMGRYKIAIPNGMLAGKLTSQVNMMVERLFLSIDEMRELSSIRDTLLPKLLSGELRIPEAGKFVETGA